MTRLEPAGHPADPGADPFGLRSLDIDTLRAKNGAKWQYRPAAYSAWVADMDFPVAPAVTDALHGVVDRNELGYPNWGGPYALSPAAKLFGPRMAERYGWEVRPDRVHDLIDVIQGVRASVHHLSAPGDGVVLHLPAYHPFLHTIDGMDRRLVPITMSGGAFDYDALESELAGAGASMWILCHPHNPLGHVFERAELERIAAIADRFDLTVISDEIHADLTLAGQTHVPFESLAPDVSARTVTVTSDVEGVQPGRTPVGGAARWVRCGSRRDAIAARPLPRRAEPAGRHSDGGGVDRGRRRGSTPWSACSTRIARRWPGCSANIFPVRGTRRPRPRIWAGSTAAGWASATIRPTCSASGVSSSAPGSSSGPRASVTCASTSPPARTC